MHKTTLWGIPRMGMPSRTLDAISDDKIYEEARLNDASQFSPSL
jgi:hypothetical protein